MITSRQAEFLSEILDWERIPTDTLVYFQERFRHLVHSALLDAFTRRAKERGLTQKELAARLHRSAVTINRWLSRPSNLSIDSVSLLMVGLAMDFDGLPFTPIEETVTSEKEKGEKNSVEPALESIRKSQKEWEALASLREQRQSDAATASMPKPNPEISGVKSTPVGVGEKQARSGSSKVVDALSYLQRKTAQEQNVNVLSIMGVANGR